MVDIVESCGNPGTYNLEQYSNVVCCRPFDLRFKEQTNCFDNVVFFCLFQFRKDRYCEARSGCFFSDRERSLIVSEIRKTRLKMQGYRVIYACHDPVLFEVRLKTIAFVCTKDIMMKDM